MSEPKNGAIKVAMAQLNCTVGDLEGNTAKMLDACRKARDAGASIVLMPELALCGYPPEDLLLRDGFYKGCEAAMARLASQVKGIVAVVGHPECKDGRRYNAASVIQ